MNREQILDKLLLLYTRYYDIEREGVEEPFLAKAGFKSHNEQYFLIKAAKVADIDSNENVYFAYADVLDEETVISLSKAAWEKGLDGVVPEYGHRNTDVILYIIADSIKDEAINPIKKTHYSKSYKFGMYGWSDFRLVAIDASKGKATFNRQGRQLKKLISNIFQ